MRRYKSVIPRHVPDTPLLRSGGGGPWFQLTSALIPVKNISSSFIPGQRELHHATLSSLKFKILLRYANNRNTMRKAALSKLKVSTQL